MIMAGFEFAGEKPFSNVYFTGIIRDAQGRKMSKSLGNSPDPLDLIDKYGADGLRFGLMLIAPKGQDIMFSEDRVEIGRNFMNKLWNASRFVMMNIMSGNLKNTTENGGSFRQRRLIALTASAMTDISLADKWILNRLQHTTKEVNKALDHYQFDVAARALYQFVWGDYCDWYLELAKTQMASDKDVIPAALGRDPTNTSVCGRSLRQTTGEQAITTSGMTENILLHVLDNILRMLHPFAPFITEELWQMVSAHGTCHCENASTKQSHTGDCFANARNDTILHANYPSPPKKIEYAKESSEMQTVMDIISAIRNIRGEHNVNPGKQIEVILRVHKKEVRKLLERDQNYIIALGRLSKLTIAEGHEEYKKCATAVAGNVDIFIPLTGMIDSGAEKKRLTKEIEKVEKYAVSLENKLSNKNFALRAPKEVVEAERTKLTETKTELAKLKGALSELNE